MSVIYIQYPLVMVQGPSWHVWEFTGATRLLRHTITMKYPSPVRVYKHAPLQFLFCNWGSSVKSYWERGRGWLWTKQTQQPNTLNYVLHKRHITGSLRGLSRIRKKVFATVQKPVHASGGLWPPSDTSAHPHLSECTRSETLDIAHGQASRGS